MVQKQMNNTMIILLRDHIEKMYWVVDLPGHTAFLRAENSSKVRPTSFLISFHTIMNHHHGP